MKPLGPPREDGHGFPKQLAFLVGTFCVAKGRFHSTSSSLFCWCKPAMSPPPLLISELRGVLLEELTHGRVSPSVELVRRHLPFLSENVVRWHRAVVAGTPPSFPPPLESGASLSPSYTSLLVLVCT